MRVIAGPEKKARLLSEKERKITAYHEMGHALVGHYLENTNPIHKITIVSRGQALGLTISLPTEDRYLTTKSALMDDLAMTLGGRAAEELVFHEVTTGAANDLEKVTATSKAMIMRYGMSEKLGPRVLGRNHDQPFLGREMGNEPDYSDEIAREIDDEIRRVIEEAHETAHRVLREHMDELHKLSAILIERETIDKDQFERLLAGEAEESVFPEEEPPSRPSRAERGASASAAPKPKPRPRARARRCSRPARPERLSARPATRTRLARDAEGSWPRQSRHEPVRRAASASSASAPTAATAPSSVDRGPPAATASTSASRTTPSASAPTSERREERRAGAGRCPPRPRPASAARATSSASSATASRAAATSGARVSSASPSNPSSATYSAAEDRDGDRIRAGDAQDEPGASSERARSTWPQRVRRREARPRPRRREPARRTRRGERRRSGAAGLGAREPGVPPECPHPLERAHRAAASSLPARHGDAEPLVAGAQLLAVAAARAGSASWSSLALAGLGERHGRDLDDREVVAAGPQVERAPSTDAVVEQRRDRDARAPAAAASARGMIETSFHA